MTLSISHLRDFSMAVADFVWAEALHGCGPSPM